MALIDTFANRISYQKLLSDSGRIEEIYQAIGNDDISEVIITTLDVLKKANLIPKLCKEIKSKATCKKLWLEGNRTLVIDDQARKDIELTALKLYNKALLYAPIRSNAIEMTYIKRSALLLKWQCPSACLKDIANCFSNSGKVAEKIEEIKNAAVAEAHKHNISRVYISMPSEEAQNIKFSGDCNRKIPCLSTMLDIQLDAQNSKIVSLSNIKVGTIIAKEAAFIGHTRDENSLIACYHCQKFNLNLIPCEGCCFALFCDNNCKTLALKEYHNFECPIIELLKLMPIEYHMSVKAVLKMKNLCTWKEFIAESFNYGNRRKQKSNINQIYDNRYKFSLLNSDDSNPFIYGKMFDFSPFAATIIAMLENLPSFLPQETIERMSAIKAIGRMLMYIVLFVCSKEVVCPIQTDADHRFNNCCPLSYGYFSCIGKLKTCCTPNVTHVGTALVSVQPIKIGEEITMPNEGSCWTYLGGTSMIKTKENILLPYKIKCNCILCSESWKLQDNGGFNDAQKELLTELDIEKLDKTLTYRNLYDTYKKLCKALAMLSDKPYTEEYHKVNKLFKRCIYELFNLAVH